VIQEVRTELSVAGYSDVDVVVRKVGTEKFDVTQLKQELQQQVFSNTLEQLQGSQKQVQRLEKELASLQAGNEDHRRLLKEISAQYPEAVSLTVSQGSRMEARRPEALPVLVVTAVVNRPIAPRNRTRLLAWLKARYDGQDVELVITDGRTSAPNRR